MFNMYNFIVRIKNLKLPAVFKLDARLWFLCLTGDWCVAHTTGPNIITLISLTPQLD